jgi:hypothetical protein
MILPMFDSKLSRKNKQELATSGVFSELKLSEQLNSNLQEVKRKFDELSDLQQDTEQQCIQLKLKVKQMQKENKILSEKVFKFKNLAKFNFFILSKYQSQNLQITSEKESLETLMMLSDKRRSEFADTLQSTVAKLDQEDLKNMTLCQTMAYDRLHHEVVMEHLQNLEANIKNVANVKFCEDKLEFVIMT